MNRPNYHQRFMQRAIELARKAAEHGDVPVGAVVVDTNNQIVGEGENRRELNGDPTAHAEVVALRAAAAHLGRWRLDEFRLYVTLEPCSMCAGALVNARIAEVIYGCADPKAGAARSLYAICDDPRLNHRMAVTRGVLADSCAALLTEFFESRRSASS